MAVMDENRPLQCMEMTHRNEDIRSTLPPLVLEFLGTWLLRTWYPGTGLLGTGLLGAWLLGTWFLGTWLLETWFLGTRSGHWGGRSGLRQVTAIAHLRARVLESLREVKVHIVHLVVFW